MAYISMFIVALLGAVLIYLRGYLEKWIKPALAFSGAYLLAICLLHLIPELFENNLDHHKLGIFILLGFFLQLVLDYFSGGIEHGHTHIDQNQLGKFPFLVFLSLCLHALLEALPLNHLNPSSEIGSYLAGLLMHKIPISFILVSVFMAYKIPKVKIIAAVIIFATMAPIGIQLGDIIGHESAFFQPLIALSIGIILHLSTTILLESNENHSIQLKKFLPLIIGFLLALLSEGLH